VTTKSGGSLLSPPASPDTALHSVHTVNLPALFDRLHISLAFSTYQAGKVIHVRTAAGTIAALECTSRAGALGEAQRGCAKVGAIHRTPRKEGSCHTHRLDSL
jgi:hypothetical protein